MQCTKPSIPSNSRIIYPRTDQVRYTHGTTLYLACHQGHLLTGSPIMVCNCTTWLKREFRCIGMFSTAKKAYYHVTRFTSLTQSCETMIKLTCDLRELVRKSCLATHLRGSVAFSEKVVHKNGRKLMTTFSMNVILLFWSEKNQYVLSPGFFLWSFIVLPFLFK